MSEVMRNAIENKQNLKQELRLLQEDFLLNEVSTILLSTNYFTKNGENKISRRCMS